MLRATVFLFLFGFATMLAAQQSPSDQEISAYDGLFEAAYAGDVVPRCTVF